MNDASTGSMNTAMTQSGAPRSGGPVAAADIDDLVAANRILADSGVLDGYGHVSMRHSGTPDRYFLSRSKSPAIITAEDIMAFDLDSNPVDQQGRLMYIERYIHGEIYKSRQDVNAIVHSHSPADHSIRRDRRQVAADMSYVGLSQARPNFLKHDVPNFETVTATG
jgi:hypothetical protein